MSESVAEKQVALIAANAKVTLFLEAEDRVVRGGQTTTIDDGDMRRTVSRADAQWIVERLAFWRSEVVRLTNEIANAGVSSRKGIYVRLM